MDGKDVVLTDGSRVIVKRYASDDKDGRVASAHPRPAASAVVV